MRVANEPASESAPGTHRPPERPLFEPPRIRRPNEGERPTTWLEFFFDLVFVVAIDQVARRLQHGVSGHSTIVYFALYGPIWWAWVGFVLYTERFGTFINISLGEGFVGLVEAMRDHSWSSTMLATAALSLVIGFAIWWGFFDNLDQAPVKEARTNRRTGPYKIWVFSQLPLAAGVAALGIAVGNLVHDADAGALYDSQRWLVCGMVALCYVAHAIVHVAYAQA